MLVKILASWLLACYALREDSLHRSLMKLQREAERESEVPGLVNTALRKITGSEKRRLQAVEEQMKQLAAREKAAEEAKMKKEATFQEIEGHTAEFGRRATEAQEALKAMEGAVTAHSRAGQAFSRAKQAYDELDAEVRRQEEHLEKAEKKAKDEAEAARQELSEKEARLQEKRAERDAVEKDKQAKEEELEKAGEMKEKKAQAHQEAQAVMHKAREALEEHQKLHEAAVEALEAASAKVLEAQEVAKALKEEHGAEKKTLEMLKKLRAGILSFYHQLDELSESLESGDHHTSAPELMKKDALLKPTLQKYNVMVKGFHELKALNPELYGTISTVVVQIKRNAFAGILLQCDPGETLEKEAVTTKDFSQLQEQCGTGLWRSQNLKRVRFPDQEASEEWWDQIEEERNLMAREEVEVDAGEHEQEQLPGEEEDLESKDEEAPMNPEPKGHPLPAEVHPHGEVFNGEEPPVHPEPEEREHKEPPMNPEPEGHPPPEEVHPNEEVLNGEEPPMHPEPEGHPPPEAKAKEKDENHPKASLANDENDDDD